MFKQAENYITEKCSHYGVTKTMIFSQEDIESFSDSNDYPRLGLLFEMEEALQKKEGTINGVYVDRFDRSNGVGASLDDVTAHILEIFEHLPVRVGTIQFDAPIVDDNKASKDIVFMQGFNVAIAE